MFLIELFVNVYKTQGYKVFIYPMLVVIAGGLVWGLMVNQLVEIFSFPLLGLFFGISYGLLNKIFGFEKLFLPGLILTISAILCLFVILYIGLYLGAYFVPIAIGVLLFTVILFVTDIKLYHTAININHVGVYLIGAVLSLLVIYLATLADWRNNLSWLYLIVYPLVAYLLIQVSLVCRLGGK